MARLLVCLPICLLVVPTYPNLALTPEDRLPPTHRERAVHLEPILVLGAQPHAAFPANLPWMSFVLLGQRSESSKQAVALLAFGPPSSFPGVFNWAMLHQATNRQGGLDLISPDGDPVAFLAKSLERYDREVQGYSLLMRKTERLGDKVEPEKTEIVEVKFREQPFSVYFHWLQGARSARRALYVEGENDNKMLTVTAFGVMRLDVDSSLVKSSSRYPITDFGFKKATERVYRGWKKAQAQGQLYVEYLGLQKVPETGDRWCHVLRRTKYAEVPEDGVTDLTLFFDRDTWLQVGSVLRNPEGKLVGEYYFRDVRLNPNFSEGQFEPGVLKK